MTSQFSHYTVRIVSFTLKSLDEPIDQVRSLSTISLPIVHTAYSAYS